MMLREQLRNPSSTNPGENTGEPRGDPQAGRSASPPPAAVPPEESHRMRARLGQAGTDAGSRRRVRPISISYA
ncbi:hypothetical protein ACU4GD_00080 [Cupriavidus basilensis]